MNDQFLFTAGMILTLVATVLMHEVGHLLYFQHMLKKKVKLRIKLGFGFKFFCGEQKDYDDLTPEQYIGVNWAGILAGLLPIIIMTIGFIPFYSLLAFPYIAGCMSDLKNIYNTKKSIGKPMFEFDDDAK